MKIHIVDKYDEDRKLLKSIIENKELGFVIGESENLKKLTSSANTVKPDLVLFDLDDSSEEYGFIKNIKETYASKLIRISKNTSKKIVENSYRAGVDYYIYKPINEYEIKTIIKKVRVEIEEKEKLRRIQKILNDFSSIPNNFREEKNLEKNLNYILLKLGIIGDKGSTEIRDLAKYIISNDMDIIDFSIRDICSKFTSNPKNMEQKMRRTINMALVNIANLGIEDYMNEVFLEYSNTLFNFEQVKKEMDYIRGKSDEKGSINMKKFISGLCLISENCSY